MIISGYDFAAMELPSKWIRFPTDFFERPTTRKLLRHQGGSAYCIIYQKIMAYASQWGGFLPVRYENNLIEELSLVLNENERDLNIVLSFLEANTLLSQEADRVYLLTEVPPMIGRDDSTERVRKHREKQKLLLQGGGEPSEKKKPMTSAERVRQHRENKKKCNETAFHSDTKTGECNEKNNRCNEDVTINALHETLQGVTDVTNVTNIALHETNTVDDEIASKSNDMGILPCNESCNVTRNVTETLHETKVTPLRIRERLRERDINTPLPPKSIKKHGGVNTFDLSEIHNMTTGTIEEYISYRKNSGGVQNPDAFVKSIIRSLSDVFSDESEHLENWFEVNSHETSVIGKLRDEFVLLSPNLDSRDRRYCRERAIDSFKHGLVTLGYYYEFVRSEVIIDIVIEIAFQQALEEKASIGGLAI